ncbi:MAG: hypothetical protein ABIT05_11520 [Chitinophagaceae bacterium]
MKLKGAIVLLIIVLSLIPVYGLYKYLARVTRPKESLQRFALWLFLVLALVFIYTFLLVFSIKMLFPGA